MPDTKEKQTPIVGQIIRDGGDAVTAVLSEDGTILLYDEDGNLTKNTIIETVVRHVNDKGKTKRVVSSYDAQGNIDTLRGLEGNSKVYTCDTNTNDTIEIGDDICKFSICTVIKNVPLRDKKLLSESLFGICWIWRGKYDIELLSWDIAMQELSRNEKEKSIMVVDSQRDKLPKLNSHELTFRSGRYVPDNFTLCYSSSDYLDTALNIAMRASHNTSRNIQKSEFKNELIHKNRLPTCVNDDEAWYAFIGLERTMVRDILLLKIDEFRKY